MSQVKGINLNNLDNSDKIINNLATNLPGLPTTSPSVHHQHYDGPSYIHTDTHYVQPTYTTHHQAYTHTTPTYVTGHTGYVHGGSYAHGGSYVHGGSRVHGGSHVHVQQHVDTHHVDTHHVHAEEIPVESRIEYIPFEKKYIEYDQVERIERIPF